MAIDPNVMNAANAQRAAFKGASDPATISAQRNKQQMGMQQRSSKAQQVAKPTIGRPAVAMGVNKKKPVLAAGSVRANAARANMEAQANQARAQGLRPGTFNSMGELDREMAMRQQVQQQQGGLDLAPTQLPFNPEMVGDGMSQYDPMAAQNSNIMADQLAMQQPGGQLNVGPSQLPFNPNSGIAGPQDAMQALQAMRAAQMNQGTNAGIGADPRIMQAQQQRMQLQRNQMQQGLQQSQRNFRGLRQQARNQPTYGRG